MNAIDILHDDHQKFLYYFDQIEKLDTSDKEKLNQLFKELEVVVRNHMKAEEDIFYTEAMTIDELRQLIEKSYQAHHFAKLGLDELHLVPYAFDSWKPKFMALRDLITLHMSEEEETVFPKAREKFSSEKLEAIGQKILELREDK
ncbi:MAG: Hemerythrin cation binding domain protein [Gammaproteobacteria bacterium]|jgi:hemerythrin superfamily protein|nr:Hemerythrin cation binding domain protein [Gammaproteobacteria bacterium]